MFNNPGGLQSLLKDGGKHFSGVDEALLKNIEAVKELAKIVRSSFGPQGTNKLVINHLGRHFVTSDTATMLKELDVQHPCGRMLVESTAQQEFECGDATNLTVMLAGSFLAEGEALLKEGLHAADVLKGYEIAMEKALQIIQKTACWELSDLMDEAQVKKAVKTTVMGKQEDLAEPLCDLIAKAVTQVTQSINAGVGASAATTSKSNNTAMTGSGDGRDTGARRFELDNVRVSKIPGGQLSKSFVVDGMVVPRDAMGTCKKKDGKDNADGKVKVAVYGNGVDFQQTEAKGTVLINNADQLMNFAKGEESQMEEFIKGLHEMGVGVLISGGAVSELAGHFLDKYQIMVTKIGSKFELRRMCASLKAVNVIRAGPPMPEELGECDSVIVTEIASQKITVFRSSESRVSTIVLRGATANVLDEWERAINDGVATVRSASKDNRFCAGGAATEMRLAREIEAFGSTVAGLEQYAVLKFAEALEIVPKILADNAGYNRVDALTALSAAQSGKAVGMDVEGESSGKNCPTGVFTGLRLEGENTVISTTEEKALRAGVSADRMLQDCAANDIVDHLETKVWALRHAMETVLTVLRVDHIIMARQAGGGKTKEM